MQASKQVNFFFRAKEFTLLKKTFFNYKIKIETKATTKTALKIKLKYSPMSEGNTRGAKPRGITHEVIH